MLTRIRIALVAACAGALVAAAPGPAAAVPKPSRDATRVPDRYIVVYRGTVDDPAAKTSKLERDKGFKARFRYRRALKGFAAKLSQRQLEEVRSDPAVAFVSPDRPVRAVIPLSEGDNAPTGVRRIDAATQTTVRDDRGANVAVIDTGIDLGHPDLNAAHGTNCVRSGAAQDDNGHGTHVAGTIGAENDGAGVVGVAPGTRTYAAKVLDGAGNGTWSQIICGIDWATSTRTDADETNDVAVANMSLGGIGDPVEPCDTTNDALHRAICNSTAAGITYVVAAGNDGWDFDYAPSPDVPAAYPEVLTVTAISDSDGLPGGAGGGPSCSPGEADDKYASFSNYAATAAGQAHTIAGPGTCIHSTWPGGYDTISGTSMATPHVAGVVASCLSEGGLPRRCNGLTPGQVIQKVRDEAQSHTSANASCGYSGDPASPVSGRYYGHLAWGGLPDTTAPAVATTSPSDGATGVSTSSGISVTFSECMRRSAAEAAFSLVRASDGAPVAGSFSWRGNTMTFKPSSALAGGTKYTAKVSTAATDAAGNAAAADAVFSFTTPFAVSVFPVGTAIQKGTLRAGSYSRLGADDNAYYEVNSTTTGTRTSWWYARFTGVTNALRGLRVTYKGKNSRTCTQSLGVYRWTTGAWVQLDSRSVGTTEVQIDRAASGTLADYVSGTTGDGEVRIRVSCTLNSASFYSSGDLMRLSYDRP